MKLIIVTTPEAEAVELLKALLEQNLVGCGNIVPSVRSMYWWDGAIQSDDESVLLMETTDEQLPAAMAAIEQLHSYDVPKILALTPAEVNESYLGWLVNAVKRNEQQL